MDDDELAKAIFHAKNAAQAYDRVPPGPLHQMDFREVLFKNQTPKLSADADEVLTGSSAIGCLSRAEFAQPMFSRVRNASGATRA